MFSKNRFSTVFSALLIACSTSVIIYFKITVEQPLKYQQVSVEFQEYFQAGNAKDKLNVNSEMSKIEKYIERANQTVVTMGQDAPVQHYRDVCIDPSEPMNITTKGFRGVMHVYDDRFRNSSVQILRIATNLREYYQNNYWIIYFKNYSKPEAWKTLKSTAYFVSYWHGYSNMYNWLEMTVPAAFGQLIESTSLLASDEAKLNKTLVILKQGHVTNSQVSLMMALGFANISKFRNLVKAGPICFEHAVFGHPAKQNLADIRKYQAMWQKHLSIKDTCSSSYVLILQRTKSRSILNAAEIVDALKGYGFKNVLVVSFEDKPLSEQLQLIQCAFAFISVQGAGAAWYRFLPDNATFVELYYQGWISKYVKRAQNSRPDIKTEAVYCKAVTPQKTWMMYAERWLKIENITDIDSAMKKKLIAKSAKKNPIRGSIWRDSNVVCDPESIVSALSTNLNGFDPSLAAAVVNPAM